MSGPGISFLFFSIASAALGQHSEQQNRSNVCSPCIRGTVSLRILIGIAQFKFQREATHLTFSWTCTSRDHDRYLLRYTCQIGETALDMVLLPTQSRTIALDYRYFVQTLWL